MATNDSYVSTLRKKPSQEVTTLITHLNLRYGDDLSYPKKRAFIQATAKTLFVLGRKKYHSFDDIRESLSNLIGISNVTPQRITEALDTLRHSEYAERRKNSWRATEELVQTNQQNIEHEAQRRTKILNQFWGTLGIDIDTLREWYVLASASIFSNFGRQWLHCISRDQNAFPVSPEDVENVLTESVKALELERYQQDLVMGYHRFMQDTSQEPALERWHLGRSMFYAQIIAYDQTADPLAVDEFRNCLVLLDTNILVIATLEAHSYHDSLKQLIDVLQDQLSTSVCFVEDTLREYNRLISAKWGQCRALFEKFELSALEDTNDGFVQGALGRGVQTVEDVEVFFGQISDLKKTMKDDYNVSFTDSEEYEEFLEKGRCDKSAIDLIKTTWQKRRPHRRPKSESACSHDAAVAELIDSLRRDKSETCFLLSNDLTLSALAKQWKTHDRMPFCLSFDAVLQVLAVEGSGPVIPEEMVASLMAEILRTQIYQESGEIRIDELLILGEQIDSVEKMDREEAQSIIIKGRESLGDNPINRNEELANAFRIEYRNRQAKTKDKQVEELTEENRAVHRKVEQVTQEKEQKEKELETFKETSRTPIRKKYKIEMWAKVICSALFFTIIYAVSSYYGWKTVSGDDLFKWSSFLVLFIQGVLWFGWSITKGLYVKLSQNLETEVERRLGQQVQELRNKQG